MVPRMLVFQQGRWPWRWDGTPRQSQMAFSFSFLNGIVISSESLEPVSILQVFKLLWDGVHEEEKEDIHLISKMASHRVI